MKRSFRQQWPIIRKATDKAEQVTWIVDARIKGAGKRHHCRTKEEAKTLADQLRIKRMNAGTAAFSMPEHERIDAQAALDVLRPHSFTLLHAAKYLVRNLSLIRADVPIVQVMDELRIARAQDGYAKVSLSSMKKLHTHFAADHPGATVQDFTTPMIDKWLRAKPVAASTRNLYRAMLGAVFSFAIKKKYTEDNPVKEVEKAYVIDKEPGILTVEECYRLMLAAHEEFLPCIALGLFAGLRPLSEIVRLNWEHINFSEGLIDIAADRTKTARKRFVTIQPNLAEWLLPLKKPSGQVFHSPTRSSVTYSSHLMKVRLVAGLQEWTPDALRHTFCSMHYAHFKNPGETANEMGHVNMAMIMKHYRARVKPDEAAAFWNIRPGQQSNVIPMIATA